MTTTRVPPHSLEAEKCLLGCMLLDGVGASEVMYELGEIGAGAFFFERHATVFEAVAEVMSREGENFDGVMVAHELVRKGVCATPDAAYTFLAEMISAVATSRTAAKHAKVVRDLWLVRQMAFATFRLDEVLHDTARSAEEKLAFAENELYAATRRRVREDERKLDVITAAMIEEFARREAAVGGLPSPWLSLDDMTTGFHAGEVIVVGARPSMGKSAFLHAIIDRVATAHNPVPVVLFSLEMSTREVASRFLCARAGVDSRVLRAGIVPIADLKRMEQAHAEISGAPIFVNDTAAMNVIELAAVARLYQRRHRIGMVCIDYMQLLTHRRAARESRLQEVSEISRQLKALAKNLAVPVIVAAQLNRAVESKVAGVPTLANLRESGQIEQDADVVILLHRPGYYDREADQTLATAIVAKNRNGPVGAIDLDFDARLTTFRERRQPEYATAAEPATEPDRRIDPLF